MAVKEQRRRTRPPLTPPKELFFAVEKMSQLSSFALQLSKRIVAKFGSTAKWGRACLPRPSEVLTRM